MGRYRIKRKLINWLKDDYRRVAKQLAGVIMRSEAVNKYSLYRRFEYLYPLVTKKVLDHSKTFQELKNDIKVEYGNQCKITVNRLWGRGDVVNRDGYKEVDHFTASVTEAYLQLVGTKIDSELDPVRDFTDDQVEELVARQKGICAIPSCRRPFTDFNWPAGDHVWPHSKGGRTTVENGAAICAQCNSQKRDMPYAEFIAKMAMQASRGRRYGSWNKSV